MRFTDHGRRVVMGAFDGGEITSDAGGLLLREVAGRLDLFGRMAACFDDRRNPKQVTHPLADLLAQRVIAMALGYEDLNDHDRVRNDPLMKVTAAARPRVPGGAPLPALAGSSTLGRLERSFEEADRRYHKFTAQPSRLQDLYVELFTGSYATAPERIILDIDATDIETHGHQRGSFFHGYYEHRCFLPLYIYCGPHLLLSKLRPGNVDGAEGAKAAINPDLSPATGIFLDLCLITSNYDYFRAVVNLQGVFRDAVYGSWSAGGHGGVRRGRNHLGCGRVAAA